MASTAPPHDHLPEYAAAVNPQYEFVPNQGYTNTLSTPLEAPPQTNDSEDEYDDDEDEDLFDDELNDQDWTEGGGGHGGGDFTKSYNRQRRIIEATTSTSSDAGAVKGNKHKPKANTAARVDDQIRSLTKFAARIKLGDVESGMSTKGDRYSIPCYTIPSY